MDVPALIVRLCALPDGGVPMRVAFVIGHPDDEVLGAGSRLPGVGAGAFIVCLTDGSPRNPERARSAGFAGREQYAQARRREFESVLAISGIETGQCLWLEIVDQEASCHLVRIARELAKAFNSIKPDLILTHPYEGGHPDHDSAAFCVSAAGAILRGFRKFMPVAEFASYNAGPQGDGWRTEFLPHPDSPVIRKALSMGEQALKRRMMECYASQKWILEAFPGDQEFFRPAPAYDFARPPHRGRLLYERFEWGMSGSRWRALAKEAAGKLGIRWNL